MAVRDILLLGNPDLWRPSATVIDFQNPIMGELINDLAETLENFSRENGYGRGIAAPQIGVGLRVVFLNIGESFPLINPVITQASQEMMELWDDCFSIPDLMIRVRRHVEVEVTYMDEHGAERQLKAQGSFSELLQHEIDHINGVLTTDRAIDRRSFAVRSAVM